jgi:hypothetical protein
MMSRMESVVVDAQVIVNTVICTHYKLYLILITANIEVITRLDAALNKVSDRTKNK